ncbi:hypothetical protein AB0M54_37370 [Actinoplanes sp. NPDC051470]
MTSLLPGRAAAVLDFGPGRVLLDSVTGGPTQFVDLDRPNRRYLLDAGVSWHSVEHQWGDQAAPAPVRDAAGRQGLQQCDVPPGLPRARQRTIIPKPKTTGIKGLGKLRYVVERTFTLLHQFRRLGVRWEA